MKVHANGLTGVQWGFCIGLGATVLIVNFFVKFLPDSIAPKLGNENPDDVKAAEEEYKELRAIADRNQKLLKGTAK
jgi:hypothetical protein